MHRRFSRILPLILLPLMVGACATPSEAPSRESLAVAKRFLHAWGAGDVAMTSLRQTLDRKAQEQPSMTELTRRVMADFKAEDFENIAAGVYARHLSQEHLARLAQFTETPVGNRFFRTAVAAAVAGKPINKEDSMRQFNADELTEILKFAESDTAAALKKALPTINREMSEEGSRLGQAKLREYLKK